MEADEYISTVVPRLPFFHKSHFVQSLPDIQVEHLKKAFPSNFGMPRACLWSSCNVAEPQLPVHWFHNSQFAASDKCLAFNMGAVASLEFVLPSHISTSV